MVVWDLLDEPWDEIGAEWNQAGSGISEINPPGYLRHLADPDTYGDTYIGRWTDIGTLPEAGYTVEFRAKVDTYGSADGRLEFQFYDGLHRVMIDIYRDRIYNRDSGIAIYIKNEEGIFYIWRLVIDSDGHSMKVYRNGVYLGDLGEGLDYTTADGTIYASYTKSNSGTCETHTDYLRIATGLHPPKRWLSPTRPIRIPTRRPTREPHLKTEES